MQTKLEFDKQFWILGEYNSRTVIAGTQSKRGSLIQNDRRSACCGSSIYERAGLSQLTISSQNSNISTNRQSKWQGADRQRTRTGTPRSRTQIYSRIGDHTNHTERRWPRGNEG